MPAVNSPVSTAMSYPESVINPPLVPPASEIKGNSPKPARVYNAHGVNYKRPSNIESGEADVDVDGELSGKALFALALQHGENNPIHQTVPFSPVLKPKGHLFHFLMWLSGAHNPLHAGDENRPASAALSPYFQPSSSRPAQQHNRHNTQNSASAHTRIKRHHNEGGAPPPGPSHDIGMTSFGFNDEKMSPEQLITQTAKICLDLEQCDQLAKTVMQWQGLYAGQPDAPLPVTELKNTIRKFIEDNTYHKGFADDTLHRVLQDNSISTVDQLRVALRPDKLDRLQDAKKEVTDFVQQNIVDQKLPILSTWGETEHAHQRDTTLKLEGVNWVLTNAGLDYYNQLTQHLEDPAPPLTRKEAHMLGEILYEQLRVGAVAAELAACFSVASLVRYSVMHRHRLQQAASKDVDTLTQQGLSAFFNDHEAYLLSTNPFLNFEHQVNQFKTRPELAQAVIDEECAKRDISVTDYLNSPDTTFCPTVDQMYLDRNKSAFVWLLEKIGLLHREGKILEDINEKFTRQNQALAEAYGKLDKILVANVFDTLPANELEFLHDASIQQLTATFRPSAPLMFQPNGANAIGQEHLKVNVKNVDLLAARQGHEERIYAMTFDGEAYSLKRIDRERKHYTALTTELLPHFTYRLDLFPLGDALHQPGMPLSVLVDPLVEKHQAHYLQQVNAAGYEATTREKTFTFLRDLVPFVQCHDAIHDGRVDDAIFNCGLDVAFFVDPLLKLGSSAVRVGQVFTAGVLKSLGNAAQAAAARQTMRTLVTQAGKDMARYAMHPAIELVIKPRAPVIVTSVLRAADPGLEFGYRLTKGTLTASVRLLNNIKDRFPRLNHLYPRIENALGRMPEAVAITGEQLKGRLTGMTKEVDVTALGAPHADGSRLCILSLPHQEATLRHQYRLSTNGELTPLPVDTSLKQRLHLILTEGLSGRGSIKPGNVVTKEIDAATLRQINNQLGKRPAASSLDELAEQFQVKKEKLAEFVREGELTQAGHDLIEQGPSGIAPPAQPRTAVVAQHNSPGEAAEALRDKNAAKTIQRGWRVWQNRIEEGRRLAKANQKYIVTHNDPKLVSSLKEPAQTARNKGMINYTPVDGKGPTLSVYKELGKFIGQGGNAAVFGGPRNYVQRLDSDGGIFDIPAVDPARYSELKSFVRAIDPLSDGERQIMRHAGKDLFDFLYVQHNTLSLQDFQRPLQDLAKLNEMGLYHLDLKLSNMAIKENAAGARTLSFIDCDGITDKVEEPLAITFRRHVLSPDTDHMIAVTGRADDEHAMALTMIQATDLSFASTSRELADLAADNDLLAPLRLRQTLHVFASRFVDKYVLAQHRDDVLNFITLPTAENVLKVPLVETLDFSAPTGIVAAIQAGDGEAITRLGSEALNKAVGTEQRVAVLIAQSGQGISGFAQLQIFKGQDAEAAFLDLYHSLRDDEKVRFMEIHRFLEFFREQQGIRIPHFELTKKGSM